MSLLTDEIKAQVKESLADLSSKVRLIVFTQTLECMFCRETRELIEDVAALSDMIEAEVYNFVVDADKAKAFKIDKIPALVVMGEQDRGIRFYGIPAGYEFTTLIHTIRLVGGIGTQLDPATVAELKALSSPVHLQVFVTPTCPFCPQAAVMAFEMAYVSDQVTADVIESSEFPTLAVKYQVAGVPLTLINEQVRLEGAVPVPVLMEQIRAALKPKE